MIQVLFDESCRLILFKKNDHRKLGGGPCAVLTHDGGPPGCVFHCEFKTSQVK